MAGSGSFGRSRPPERLGKLASTIALETHLLFQAPAPSATRVDEIRLEERQLRVNSELLALFILLLMAEGGSSANGIGYDNEAEPERYGSVNRLTTLHLNTTPRAERFVIDE